MAGFGLIADGTGGNDKRAVLPCQVSQPAFEFHDIVDAVNLVVNVIGGFLHLQKRALKVPLTAEPSVVDAPKVTFART